MNARRFPWEIIIAIAIIAYLFIVTLRAGVNFEADGFVWNDLAVMSGPSKTSFALAVRARNSWTPDYVEFRRHDIMSGQIMAAPPFRWADTGDCMDPDDSTPENELADYRCVNTQMEYTSSFWFESRVCLDDGTCSDWSDSTDPAKGGTVLGQQRGWYLSIHPAPPGDGGIVPTSFEFREL